MQDSILYQLGFDPFFIIAALAVITVVLLVLVIIGALRMKQLYRSYDCFMRGKDAESLENMIMNLVDEIANLKAEDRANKDSIRVTNKNMRASIQKVGTVKYNAFKGMGGNLSFAIALLDYTNSGVVINSVHGREGCFLYLKEVDRGETEVMLGSEEKMALEQALGYKEKPV